MLLFYLDNEDNIMLDILWHSMQTKFGIDETKSFLKIMFKYYFCKHLYNDIVKRTWSVLNCLNIYII